MVSITEVRKVKLNGCDRMNLEKYSETYMEYSYFNTSAENLSFEGISWRETTENPYVVRRFPWTNKK